MADYKQLVPHVLQWEGGLVNDPDDSGGLTNQGITLATWKLYGFDNDGDGDIDAKDLIKMSRPEWEHVFKHFWDECKGDQIKDQKIANILVDWFWGSGSVAKKEFQRALKDIGFQVDVDGAIGNHTLTAANSCDAHQLTQALQNRRIQFYKDLATRRPKDQKFLHGWINRAQALYQA